MRDFRDAKAMAQTLREALKAKSVSLTHSESLEVIAKTLGVHDWNELAATIQSSRSAAAQSAALAPATVLPSMSAGAAVPIIPIRDLVLFPQTITPIFIGRDKTIRAVESAMASDGLILAVTQRRSAEDDPALDDLYSIGVIAGVINRLTQPDGTLKVFVSGLKRATIVRPAMAEFLAAEVASIEEIRGSGVEAVALSRAVLNAYQTYAKVDFSALQQAPQGRFRLPSIGDPSLLADSVAPLLSIGIDKQQQILETSDVVTRLEMILDLMKAGRDAA